MATTEGRSVNVAFTGPSIEHDKLIAFSATRNAEDRKRASSAGESRATIKEFLDETGMNGKALSWCRQILKIADKDDGQAKAMDVIMSLKKCLPMIESHVSGQGSMAFDLDEPEHFESEVPTEIADRMFVEGDPEIAEESAAFEKHLDEVVGGNAA